MSTVTYRSVASKHIRIRAEPPRDKLQHGSAEGTLSLDPNNAACDSCSTPLRRMSSFQYVGGICQECKKVYCSKCMSSVPAPRVGWVCPVCGRELDYAVTRSALSDMAKARAGAIDTSYAVVLAWPLSGRAEEEAENLFREIVSASHSAHSRSTQSLLTAGGSQTRH